MANVRWPGMTCPRCNNFGLVSVGKDPDIDEPCDCPEGIRWMTSGERAMRALYDLKDME